MFIDNQWKKEKKVDTEHDDSHSSNDHRSIILLFVGFTVLLVVVIIGVFWGVTKFSSTPGGPDPDPGTSSDVGGTSSPGDNLPKYDDKGENHLGDSQFATTSVEAEKLKFGDFYEQPSHEYDMATSSIGYELPIQVKTEVSNFYDVDRKIDLDDQIEDLNNNGFALISNPFPQESDNFYSMYRKLEDEGIPMVVTKDFLNYYYQYVLKKNFKRVESDMFYNNLWNINKTLYEQAKLRYENLRESEGLSNDPYVQGARMETAYFAVALKLLEPQENQLSGSKLDSEDKFSQEEANRFSIELPYYLEDDVPREVDLILESRDIENKSSVLFYTRNYGQFQVPKEYENNARLKNVYLASKWMNSLLPLYYRDDDCPDCKVDKADWRIGMAAAILMSRDFAHEQGIKNNWAQVYKVVSYFNGLRDEMTYLQYARELQDVLGDDGNLKESFFNKDLQELDDKLHFLREELVSGFDFTGMEGAHDHTATSGRPQIGFRVLSQPYVPNEYIYKQLTYPNVGELLGKKERQLRTACEREDELQRCRAISLDVFNLLQPVSSSSNETFYSNASYENYESQVELLRDQLDRFDEYAWHGSNYWNTFYIYKKAFDNINPENPMLAGDAWIERNIESFRGALALTQLGADELSIYQGKNQLGESEAGQSGRVEKYNHIEPNLVLVREMRANLEMVRGMLRDLGISEEISSVASGLEDAQDNFEELENILEKQLSAEELNRREIDFLKDFVTKYEVDEKREKELKHEYAIKESVEGVKLLALVYRKGDRMILGVGPVFNYKEGR